MIIAMTSDVRIYTRLFSDSGLRYTGLARHGTRFTFELRQYFLLVGMTLLRGHYRLYQVRPRYQVRTRSSPRSHIECSQLPGLIASLAHRER